MSGSDYSTIDNFIMIRNEHKKIGIKNKVLKKDLNKLFGKVTQSERSFDTEAYNIISGDNLKNKKIFLLPREQYSLKKKSASFAHQSKDIRLTAPEDLREALDLSSKPNKIKFEETTRKINKEKVIDLESIHSEEYILYATTARQLIEDNSTRNRESESKIKILEKNKRESDSLHEVKKMPIYEEMASNNSSKYKEDSTPQSDSRTLNGKESTQETSTRRRSSPYSSGFV